MGLLHARFTYTDRHEKEHYWVKALGKTGWHERVKKGRIIIGTQVLEQSLDIDADLLISNFAPTDMLLQRLGRLWRHQNTPRPQSATCCAYFIIPHNVQQHNAFGVSGIIYSEYILHRSLEAWQQCLDRTSSIVLPDHVRWLIDTTYTKRTEHGQLQRYYDELYQGTQYKKGVEALKQLARGSTATIGIQDDDRHAQTRYNEEPTASILLIQDIKINSEQKSTTIILLNGDQLTLHWSYQSKNWQTYQDISIKLMAEMVDCRLSKLPPTPLYEHCKKIGFGHVLYLGHKKNNHIDFAIAKVGVGGNLDFYEVIEPTNYSYRYRKDLGLQIQKNTQMPFD